MDLNVGDKVVHRGCWGRGSPEIAKVTEIQRNEDEGTDKYITTPQVIIIGNRIKSTKVTGN